MEFGKRLKEARERKHISQEYLAEVVSVSRQSVSKWENNECYPTVEKLIKLAEYLDVSIDWLFEA